MTRRLDWLAWLGLALVAVTAAVASFVSLWDLAVACSWPQGLGWLLPVSVDAAVVTATRVWLTSDGRVRVYARALALATLAASVAGNATVHGLTADHTTPAWWLAVIVSAVPPAMLGATAHLAALVTAEQRDTTEPAAGAPPAPEATRTPAPVATPAAPERATRTKPHKVPAVDVMREHYAAQVKAGRGDQVTGAELDRAAGTKGYGRKVIRDLRAETEEQAA